MTENFLQFWELQKTLNTKKSNSFKFRVNFFIWLKHNDTTQSLLLLNIEHIFCTRFDCYSTDFSMLSLNNNILYKDHLLFAY